MKKKMVVKIPIFLKNLPLYVTANVKVNSTEKMINFLIFPDLLIFPKKWEFSPSFLSSGYKMAGIYLFHRKIYLFHNQ